MGVIDAAKYFSSRYSGRKPSAIRQIMQSNMGIPGMLSLAGGLPNPKLFPIAEMNLTLKDGTKVELSKDTLNMALQYSSSYGLPPLVKILQDLQKRHHSPKNEVSICVGTGSQALLAQAFDMLLNKGDPLLVEAPTYPGALSALQPIAPSYVPVQTDGEGMVPADLARILDGWDSSRPKPKVLYIIPTGQNPNGATVTASRRREIYELARRHELIILEDDPYYYLYLGRPGQDARTATPPPSFLSLDEDGRVLRFDSMSKVLSSGLRIGFITGQHAFVENLQLDMQGTSLHTSGMSQAVVLEIMQKWGEKGWEQHVAEVKAFYASRRDVFLQYLEKHLKGLAEWTVPEAGMFVWLKLTCIDDSFELISKKAHAEKVLLVPGKAFYTTDTPSNCVRASFSLASDADLEEAVLRLKRLLEAEVAGK